MVNVEGVGVEGVGVGGEKERGNKKGEGSLGEIFFLFSVIIIILCQNPHKKPSPYFFNYTPKRKKALFQTVDIKPVQILLYWFKNKLNQFK